MKRFYAAVIGCVVMVLGGCIGPAYDTHENDDMTIDPPLPHDACIDAGITNMLIGSCWWEQCVKGEKMLVPKIAGVNCVFKSKKAGNDEFAVGSCDELGECVE